jgi:transposase
MAVCDRHGRPVAALVASPLPHEVTLVAATLAHCFVAARPARLVGDRAYDSDPLDRALAAAGTQLIAPHRANRRKPRTQDGRPLRRLARRWKVERLNAWLQHCRRLVTRYEYYVENFAGFLHLACLRILLRRYMR